MIVTQCVIITMTKIKKTILLNALTFIYC